MNRRLASVLSTYTCGAEPMYNFNFVSSSGLLNIRPSICVTQVTSNILDRTGDIFFKLSNYRNKTINYQKVILCASNQVYVFFGFFYTEKCSSCFVAGSSSIIKLIPLFSEQREKSGGLLNLI